jgi:hypothetical protein
MVRLCIPLHRTLAVARTWVKARTWELLNTRVAVVRSIGSALGIEEAAVDRHGCCSSATNNNHSSRNSSLLFLRRYTLAYTI